jgi:AraC-like DNA-binding protein/TolB-like protein
MSVRASPASVRKTIELIVSDPARSWTLTSLAAACGVAPRTLQKQFRRHTGRGPIEYLRDARLDHVRQTLLRASDRASIADIAMRSGFNHLGRFAAWYRERYGETPSATLRRMQTHAGRQAPILPLLSATLERPAVVVLPFDLVGHEASRAAGMPEHIAAALVRLRWINVSLSAKARYWLRGKVRANGGGRLRVTVLLGDSSSGRVIWADHWEGRCDDAFEFEERVAAAVARAIEPTLQEAEIDRASSKVPEASSAWELSMRAMPLVLSYKSASAAVALEFLERAMELAPHDPLPVALASWCRGMRGCLHLTPHPEVERKAAHALAAQAAALKKTCAITETALVAGFTLSHDLSTAASHAHRALALDGGSAWAWARSGWIGAYRGEAGAVERLQIARALAPRDRLLSSSCCFGIAAPYMQAERHNDGIRWIKRGLAEHPGAVRIYPFLAAAYALEHRKEETARTLAELRRSQPDITIAEVKTGWPFEKRFLDRIADGLESAGLRPGP